MKSLRAMLLLACWTTASAQHAKIVGFDRSGTLTWSNALPSVYWGLEVKWDLGETWVPMADWDSRTTGSVVRTTAASDSFLCQLENVSVTLGVRRPPRMFFRVVTSPLPLAPRFATNLVRLVNASTSELANVEIGVVEGWSHNPLVALPVLPRRATTPTVPIVQDIPVPDSGVQSNVVAVIRDGWVKDGWYVSYDDAGRRRVAECIVVPFGYPDKKIVVTASNDSATIEFQWLGASRTFPY